MLCIFVQITVFVNFTIMQSSELEASTISIERLKEYSDDIPSEVSIGPVGRVCENGYSL